MTPATQRSAGLFMMARAQALVTYRAAYRRGEFGTAITNITGEVLRIAAEVLWRRVQRYRRVELFWLGLVVLAALLYIGVTLRWPDSPAHIILLGALGTVLFEYAGARGARRAYTSACTALAGRGDGNGGFEVEEPLADGDAYMAVQSDES